MSYGGFEYGTGGYDEGGYGGAATYGGGGFMNNASQSNMYMSPNAQASPAKRANRERQSIRPVTVRQILTATQEHPDDAFRVDGHEVSQIRLVGFIVEAQEQSTNLTVQLEDGTGRIEVKKWIDNNDNEYTAQRRGELQSGIYVQVIGNLRTFQEKFTVMAFDIRPVDSFDQITHHFLECIYVHLQLTRGPLTSNGSMPGSQPQQPGRPGGFGETGSSGYGGYGGYSGSTGQQVHMGHGDELIDGLSPNQAKIVNVFKQSGQADSGLSVHAVVQMLAGQIPENEIRDAISFLSSEGHLYSTIDEQHFKSTV